MIQRLGDFIEYQDISVRAFEKKIGASDGMIRRAINNNTDIQSKWISNIADIYPQLNIEWLVTGKGSMLRAEGSKQEVNKDIVLPGSQLGIQLVSDYQQFIKGNKQSADILYVIPNLTDTDGLTYIKDAAMYPRYAPGDIVGFKLLPSGSFWQWNKVYIITTDQGVLTRRVQQSDDEGCITLAADNPEYQPFQISTNNISSIAIITALIRIE